MTVEQFSTYVIPETSQIVFFVDEGYIIKAANISTTACEAINTFDALAEVKSISVSINGSLTTLPVVSYTVKNSYYAFVLEPVAILGFSGDVSTLDSTDCNLATFLPSANDATFENSNYNALINNALDIRLNSFVYDVDRKRSMLNPTNLTNILDDTALFGTVPDSNYTSIGLLRSRYEGAETSIEEYGIESAFNLIAFEGAIYSADVEMSYICSQSFSDRKIKEMGFIKSNALVSNISTYPDTSGFRQNPLDADGFIFSPNSNIGVAQTHILIRFENTVNISTGDILGISQESYSLQPYTDYEFVEVEEVISTTPAVGNRTEYSLKVKRGITGQSNAISPAAPLTLLYVFKIKSDTIYQFDSNIPSKLTNKFIYIPNTQKVLYVGITGKVVYTRETCTI